MTDKEFQDYFDSLTDSELLYYLSNIVDTVILRNGNSYHTSNEDGLKFMIEQELYQDKTGRE